MRVGWLALLASCGTESDPIVSPHPCASDGVGLEVAPPDGDYGELVLGGDFWAGIPPQGGAPYSPLRLRIRGPDALFDGVDVFVDVFEDDMRIAETSQPLGLVCANVGENAGHWVGAEVHLRYDGLDLEALVDRSVTVRVEIVAQTDASLVASRTGQVRLVVD